MSANRQPAGGRGAKAAGKGAGKPVGKGARPAGKGAPARPSGRAVKAPGRATGAPGRPTKTPTRIDKATGKVVKAAGRPAKVSSRPLESGRVPMAPTAAAKGRPRKGGSYGSGRGARPAAKPDRGLGGTQVEGRHSVRELLLAGQRRVTEVLIAAEMDHADIVDDIVELAQDLKVPVREVSKRRLDTESRTEASQGVMAYAAELPEHDLDDLASPSDPDATAPFLLAVDGVTDPGNLGALIRTAECAGVTGLLLPRHRAVHISPTVTKAAAGAIEHVPMALVGGLPTAIERLKELGVWVIGLDAGGEQSLHDMPIAGEPVCLVLGAEGTGLSRLVRERCDVTVSIPLRGRLSSLNVATAGALACYEIVRRRPVP